MAGGAVAFCRFDVGRGPNATSPGLAANLILSLGGSFVSAANTAKAKKTSERISTTPKSFREVSSDGWSISKNRGSREGRYRLSAESHPFCFMELYGNAYLTP